MRSVRTMKRTILSTMALAPALLLAALLVPAGAAAAGPITTAPSCTSTGSGTVTCDLWAKPGTLALPGTSVTAWGYSTTAGGSPSFPGPAIVVNVGDSVTVNLTNDLAQPTSLVFNGLATVPDLTAVAPGASHPYTFTASTPGTYLYEAGILPGSEYQVSMGLHGALIVRPQGAANRAYADASTAFADEALVIVSEIDPALNNNASPQGFDLRNFAPKYFLVNGTAYSNAAPTIPVTSGNSLLLRYANAGILSHSMGVLGLHQRVLAADGSELPAQRTMVAETLAPGQSADVLVTLPATTAASTLYPVYDAAMVLNNSSVNGMGGMLALLDATPGTGGGGDTVGPVTSGVSLAMPAGDLTATVDDALTGGSQVAAAEYFIDTVGASGTGTSMTGTPTPPAAGPVAFAATIPAATLAGLSNGMHTVYVHGQDSAGNWGSFATVLIDKAGPTTSALTLTPNPSNGSVSVAISGTASDAASGGSNVVAAEYFLGATAASGTGTALTVVPAATVSLSATISPPVSSAVVSVHAQDAAGNWGPFATISLSVDNAGPATSGLTLTPSSANGQAVAIGAAASDTATGNSVITAGEYFINSAGADGSGTALSVGAASPSTTLSGTIPATTVAALAAGNRTVFVHARDAAGNWGAPVTATLLIDRTAPTFTSITLAAINPTLGGGIRLTVNGATDPSPNVSGVSGGEYWLDTPTRPAAGGTSVHRDWADHHPGRLAHHGQPHGLRPGQRRCGQLEHGHAQRIGVHHRGRHLLERLRDRRPSVGLDLRVHDLHQPPERDHRHRPRRCPEPAGTGRQHQLRPVQLRGHGEPGRTDL